MSSWTSQVKRWFLCTRAALVNPPDGPSSIKLGNCTIYYFPGGVWALQSRKVWFLLLPLETKNIISKDGSIKAAHCSQLYASEDSDTMNIFMIDLYNAWLFLANLSSLSKAIEQLPGTATKHLIFQNDICLRHQIWLPHVAITWITVVGLCHSRMDVSQHLGGSNNWFPELQQALGVTLPDIV